MNPKLLSCTKIWDAEPHCALTDLIHYRDVWFCTFRESDKHVYGKDGVVRIIKSIDGTSWTTAAEFREEGSDLRDPKLSITPDGSLMLLLGVTIYKDKTYITRQSRVCFSQDGIHWSSMKEVLVPHEWLWRVTWHEGIAYGVSYISNDPKTSTEDWIVKLYKSPNGLDYELITQWDVPGYPSESTVHFLSNGTMIALVRRGKRRDNQCLDWS